MSSREIITIQCGHYSNFVGTHWWNLQESAFSYDETSKQPKEISNDCTFREGLTLNGELTYTPRLIALDLSSSLNTLKEDGHLYDNPNREGVDRSVWHKGVETHAAEATKKNEFLSDLQQLDCGKMEAKDMESKMYELHSSVGVWSDFLRIHLHPKSLLTIPGIFHGYDSSFQSYPAGRAVWDLQLKECFGDRLHYFVEECDSLQGFQLLVDQDDGFGALGSCLTEELADEFGQKGILAVPISPGTCPLDQTKSFHATMLNHALCLDDLCTNTSVVCPMSLLVNPWRSHAHPHIREFPSVHYEPTFPYHSAAVLAAALETASLLYRVQQPPLSLPSMADTITRMGRKVCGIGVSVPLSLPTNSSLLEEWDRNPLHAQLRPLTPFCSPADQCWAQCVSVRGIPDTYPLCSTRDPRYSYCGRHVSMALSSHLSQHFPVSSTTTHLCAIQKPLSIGNPFPAILPHQYYQDRQVPCCASFQSLSGVGDMLTALSSELQGLDIRHLPVYTSCLDSDNYTELKDRLVSLGECYRTKPNLDESSDSD